MKTENHEQELDESIPVFVSLFFNFSFFTFYVHGWTVCWKSSGTISVHFSLPKRSVIWPRGVGQLLNQQVIQAGSEEP